MTAERTTTEHEGSEPSGASTRMYHGTDRPMVPHGSEARVPDANIAESLRAIAARLPGGIAVRQPVGRESGGMVAYESWTFRELDREVDRLCHGLTRHGIERGMRTVLMVPFSREFFSLTFALFRIGAVPVLVDPGMGVKSLGKCLGGARPEAFIGVPKAHVARIALGWARRTLRLRVTVGRKGPWRGPTLARVRREAEMNVPYDAPRTRADETAAILFTSGSTGTPKGAVYHHGIFPAQVEQLRTLYGIREGEVDLPTFPLFGLFDVSLGTTAVIPEMDFSRPGDADPRLLFDAIDRFAVRNLFASPALLRNLALHGAAEGRRLTTLDRVLSAGAPVPAEDIALVRDLLRPGIQVHTPYGATEALPVATIGSDEILGATAEETRTGAGVCVGRPAPGMRVVVIPVHDDPIETWDASLPLAAGSVGEICVRGAVVTRSYFGLPEATAAAKVPDGDDVWHRMGDLGYFDAVGRLWFQGRKAHRVTTPWGPLDTAPVEGIFDTHPEVRRSALVGLGRRGAQRPVVCIERTPGSEIPEERLFAELHELGAQHERTADIEHFLVHPSFPVDIRHNAKIFREELALWAGGRLGESIP